MQIRRAVQRHLLAAIERIESLHLGGIHRSGPESALQATRDAEQLRRDSYHPDLREALDLLRVWDLEGSGGLALFARERWDGTTSGDRDLQCQELNDLLLHATPVPVCIGFRRASLRCERSCGGLLTDVPGRPFSCLTPRVPA